MCKYHEDKPFAEDSNETKLLYLTAEYGNKIIKCYTEKDIKNVLQQMINEIENNIDTVVKIAIIKKYRSNNITRYLETPHESYNFLLDTDFEKLFNNDLLESDGKYIINNKFNNTFFVGPIFLNTEIWGCFCVELSESSYLEVYEALASITNFINSSIEKMIYEKRILEKERFIKTITDSIPDFIWSKDVHGKYLFTNKSFREFLDANDEKEPIGKQHEYFYNKKKQKYEKQNFKPEKHEPIDKKVLDNMENIHYIDEGYNKDEYVVLDIFKAPLIINDDEKGLLAHAIEITDITKTKHLLYSRSALLSVITNQIPSILFARDIDNNLLYANTKFLESNFFEKPPTFDDIVGRNIKDIFSDDKNVVDAIIEIDNKTKETLEEQEVVIKRDIYGSLYWFGCINVPLIINTDDVIGILTIGKDITSKINAVDELRDNVNNMAESYLKIHEKESAILNQEMKNLKESMQRVNLLNSRGR